MKMLFKIKMLFVALLLLNTSFAQSYITKPITFETLKGTWEAKGSRDMKIFKDNKLSFRSIESHCYLKSSWTFDSDSTAFIVVEGSDKCAATTIKFKYQLLESPGYGGPMYKMTARFENGDTETLSLMSKDGEKNMKLGYNQPFYYFDEISSYVYMYYDFKKQ
jgi:hypothetical protein